GRVVGLPSHYVSRGIRVRSLLLWHRQQLWHGPMAQAEQRPAIAAATGPRHRRRLPVRRRRGALPECDAHAVRGLAVPPGRLYRLGPLRADAALAADLRHLAGEGAPASLWWAAGLPDGAALLPGPAAGGVLRRLPPH